MLENFNNVADARDSGDASETSYDGDTKATPVSPPKSSESRGSRESRESRETREVITTELIREIYPESRVRPRRIAADQVDDDDKLRLSILIQMMQEIEDGQCEDFGIGQAFLKEMNLTWLYVNAYYAFNREFPRLGEDVILETWMHQAKGIRFLRENAYYTSEGLWGSSSGEWLLVDRDTRKPAKPQDVIEAGNLVLPETQRSALKRPSGMRRLRAGTVRPEDEPSLKYTVQTQDIDLNEHLHNTIYIELMMQAIKTWAGPHVFRACQFSFLQEVFLDECLEYYIMEDEPLEIQGELWDLARMEAWVKGKDEAAFVSQVAFRKNR